MKFVKLAYVCLFAIVCSSFSVNETASALTLENAAECPRCGPSA